MSLSSRSVNGDSFGEQQGVVIIPPLNIATQSHFAICDVMESHSKIYW